MSATDRAAELRALADHHESMAGLEAALEEAADAYRADKTEDNKAAYEHASQELRDARAGARSSGATAVSSEPGSATPTPRTAKAKKGT